LFVCLGNICRSPTAEGVFRHLLAQEIPALQVEVDSAGTADYHTGDQPDLRTQRAALRRGIDLSGLRARQVTAGDFERFDFILAMDRNNLLELEAGAAFFGLRPRFGPAGSARPLLWRCQRLRGSAGSVPRRLAGTDRCIT
jgi:hypothetical protein